MLPDVAAYNPQFQNRLADELAAQKEQDVQPCPRDVVIADCSAWHRTVLDFLLMRDQTRALQQRK